MSGAVGGESAVTGDPMIGRVLDGRFTIESRLGAGSMGTVYRAKQHAMGRNVAIKILRSDRALDDAARARFLREARANSLLASPHTVTVFDFGQADNGDFFLAMELLEGESVGQRIQRMKRVPAEQAIDTARQALRSLAEAHAKGIIHRDLKPDNLFYAKVLTSHDHIGRQHEELVKVLDFGIAKMLHDEDRAMNAVETQAGTVFGTPRYMSPEQAQGKPLDARSDLYSLGVILYHMLTGRPPFTDDDAIVVMARHIKTAPKPPSEACPAAHIPPEVESVLLRVLAKDPAQRPSSAEQMSQELARALNLSGSATSGVRASVSGSTIPPVSSRTSLPMPAPVSGLGAAYVPTAPLSAPFAAPDVDSDPDASLAPVDSMELAAVGVPHRRRRRIVVMGAVAAAFLIGGIAVGVSATSASGSRGLMTRATSAEGVTSLASPQAPLVAIASSASLVGASATSTTAHGSAASVTGAMGVAGMVAPSIPPAPPSVAAASGSGASLAPHATSAAAVKGGNTSATSFTDLPHASSKGQTSKPKATLTPKPAPPPPAPSTTGTGHYGLFE